MGHRDKISVIIPVYRVEPWLCVCVDSVLNQTYQDLEVILVDDGSPDKCPEICDQYARQDIRVRVIHQENQGVGVARNAGLDIASGEYVAFVDSDDWIEPQMLEQLYAALDVPGHGKADLSICGSVAEWPERSECRFPCQEGESLVLTGTEALVRLPENFCWWFAWNKLYRREIWHDLRFPAMRRSEDISIMHLVLYRCRTIACVQSADYHYRKRTDSLTATTAVDDEMVILEMLLKWLCFLMEKDKDVQLFRSDWACFWWLTQVGREAESVKDLVLLLSLITQYEQLHRQVLVRSRYPLVRQILTVVYPRLLRWGISKGKTWAVKLSDFCMSFCFTVGKCVKNVNNSRIIGRQLRERS